MKTPIWIATVAACVASFACSDADFEPSSHITGLRLLALRADRPFARPGERVELTLLTVDAEARELQWAYATCRKPQSGAADACLSALDGPFEPLPDGPDGLALDVPEDALDDWDEDNRHSAAIGVALVACPGVIERGETQGVPIACRDAGGKRVSLNELEVGIKRIFLREQDRNENPEIRAVLWDGEDWPQDEVKTARACEGDDRDIEKCDEDLRHALELRTSKPEAGEDELGEPYAEQQVVQFYATHGVFRDQVRVSAEPDNQWAAQGNGDGDLVTLWFVVRDDRGGVTWTERQVELR